MARITLHVETDDASEMREQIAQLFAAAFGAIPMQFSVTLPEVGDDEPEAAATQDAAEGVEQSETEPGERQRRTRRTKAQIAEDNARAAAGGSTGEAATPASEPSTVTGAGSEATGGDTSDPFAEQKAPLKLSPTTSDASPASLADVKKAMEAYLATPGATAAKMKEIVRSFPGVEGSPDPIVSVTQMHPDHYAACIAALNEG